MIITSLEPTSGAAGTQVTIELIQVPLNADFSNTSVFLNGVFVPTITQQIAVGQGTLTVAIQPESTTGTFIVVAGSPSERVQSGVFAVLPPMQITNFQPQFGPPGIRVTLSLSGMPQNSTFANTSVLLSGNLEPSGAPIVQPNGNGTVTATIQPNSQTGEFRILAGDPLQEAQSAGSFTVIRANNEPAILTLNPGAGLAGTIISLEGNQLGQTQAVQLRSGTTSSQRIVVFLVRQNDLLRFRVPTGLPPGLYRIFAFTPTGRINAPRMFNLLAGDEDGREDDVRRD